MAKVLLIDDDLTITRMLEEMLDRSGFEVVVANSGASGIEAVRQHKPDVIVLDLMMPEVSGWEACREIRKFSQTPILVLSATVRSEDVMRSLEEGANDYLVKPVPRGILLSHLNKLINQAGIQTK